MPIWETLGMQAAGQAASGAMGLFLQRQNDQRQLGMERKLQRMQMEGTKEMTDYNMSKQLQMWKDTSYPAQMEMLRKAGLNPGLIYGMSGGGGQTPGATQGAGATLGAGPKGGGEIAAMMQMGIERQMAQAQIDLMKAQANKTNIEANKTAGVDTKLAETTIDHLKQTIDSQKSQQALTNIQTELAKLDAEYQSATMENRKSLVNMTLSKLIEETKIIENDRQISDATVNDAIRTIKGHALQVYLQNALIKSQKTLTDEQTKVANQQINNLIQQVTASQKEMQLDDLKTRIIETQAFKDAQDRGDINLDDILRNIGILLPIPGRKGSNPIRGFHDRK